MALKLLQQNYEISATAQSLDRVVADSETRGLLDRIELAELDVTDERSARTLMHDSKPDEVYHLAARSSVTDSLRDPARTLRTNAVGTANVLEAVAREVPAARVFVASSVAIFAGAEPPITETSCYAPTSPYGASKLAAHLLVGHYRSDRALFVCSGILSNHESPIRPETFVTRKITLGVARIAAGVDGELVVGNLSSRRDWGFAGDFVDGIWRMLQQDVPQDYVLCTGETHTVREAIQVAFGTVGLEISWDGSELSEVGVEAKSGQALVRVSADLFRRTDQPTIEARNHKAATQLGWRPTVGFGELIQMMVASDVNAVATRASDRTNSRFSSKAEGP